MSVLYICVGKGQPVPLPTLIDSFPPVPVSDLEAHTDAAEEEDAIQNGAFGKLIDGHYAVDIACGGGFSVAVMKSGHVCSWGLWAQGRLGQGETPLLSLPNTSRSYSRSNGNKRYAKYCMRPNYLPGITTAVSVSCGEMHTMCVLHSGALLGWGLNSCGQLGIGITASGLLLNADSPVLIPPFLGQVGSTSIADSSRETEQNSVVVKAVVAGSFHTVALDTRGRVWTWGGRGGACLGQADRPLSGVWAERLSAIFPLSVSTTSVSIYLHSCLYSNMFIPNVVCLSCMLGHGPV